MTPEDIKQLLKRAPFKPFVLVMSNSERHEVYHPEMLMVGRTILALGMSKPRDPDPIADYIIWLSPEHVLKVEPLELSKTS